MFSNTDTICAIATSAGMGAIAVIRLAGKDAIQVCQRVFKPAKKEKILTEQKANTIHFGSIQDKGHVIDEVLVSLFKAPHSYTGEDIVEISCHGSVYIQQQIMQLLIKNGARAATAGEFTMRAFINGKMDLSQAEAVADLISANSESSQKVAINQMRGGVSSQIKNLRDQLLHFISLIELELDFSEEDVEFADRTQLKKLLENINQLIEKLTSSFNYGNAIKQGIPVAIIGEPNVGKSTLLNILLNEERAIVSEIAGTTRDVIEDCIVIDGITFRFIDTAGLRHTTDTIESLGIKLTYSKIKQANVVMLLVDNQKDFSTIQENIKEIKEHLNEDQKLIVIANKIDKAEENLQYLLTKENLNCLEKEDELILISAKNKINIEQLLQVLIKTVSEKGNYNLENDAILTNVRHFEALEKSHEAILRVLNGLEVNISGDFLSMDIREALHYLGEITGEISTDEILGNIFKNFCIGK